MLSVLNEQGIHVSALIHCVPVSALTKHAIIPVVQDVVHFEVQPIVHEEVHET